MKSKVWATSIYSPMEISEALRKLKVSHVLSTGRRELVFDSKRKQPSPVRIASDLNDVSLTSINFIVASIAELNLTNYKMLPRIELTEALKTALQDKSTIKPKVRVLSPIDYVEQVARPSLLNKVQTEIYKIQPYALRKQTNAIVLSYLNSKISKKKLRKLLADNLKHEALLPLLLSADSLRDAVAEVAKGQAVEQVAEASGHPTFELLYLSKERK